MEDLKVLIEEVSDLSARTADMIIAWAKKYKHNPNFILNLVGGNIQKTSQIGDFKEYKPRYSGVYRAMSNKQLAEVISEMINEFDDTSPEEVLNTLNKEVDL